MRCRGRDRRLASCVVLAMAVAGCTGDAEVRTAPEPAGPVAASETSAAYLAGRGDGSLRWGAGTVVEGSAVLFGGARTEAVEVDGEEATALDVVHGGVVVDPSGAIRDVPPLPGVDPLFSVEMSATGGTALVRGTACRTGFAPDDDGETGCEPGDLVLAALDVATNTWSVLAPPPEALDVPPGTVHVEASASGTALWVVRGSARSVWLAPPGTDDWRPVAAPPDDSYLVSDGRDVYAVSEQGRPDGDEIVGPEVAVVDAALELQRLDPSSGRWRAAEPGPAAAVRSFPEVHGGSGALVATAYDADGATVVFALTDEGGWRTIADPALPRAATASTVGAGAIVLTGPSGAASVLLDLATGDVRRLEPSPDELDVPTSYPLGEGAVLQLGHSFPPGYRLLTP